MVLRRVAYLLQFPLAVALPVWVFVGRGVLGAGGGWDLAAYLLICPVLFVGLAIVCGVSVARGGARRERALSLPVSLLLAALWLSLLVFGAFEPTALVLLPIGLLVAVFWVAVFELVGETRRRVLDFVDGLALTAQPARGPQPPRDLGEVYVIPRGPDSR